MTATVRVTGRVQGVWFRGWTLKRAQALGLDGWVRNEPDGSVRALISGPEAEVRRLLVALEQGPPAARVDTVSWEVADDDVPAGFRIT